MENHARAVSVDGGTRHVTNSTNITTDVSQDHDQGVEAKQNTSYLGFWLDSELSGKAKLDKAVARVTKAIQALSAITGLAWGAT